MTNSTPETSENNTNFNEPVKQQATSVLDSVLDKESKPKKPCWQRKRYWFLAFLVVAIWFTMIPSCPKKITLESHFITEPRTADGRQVDYFRFFEEQQLEMLKNPDENGFRLVLQALGPFVLEQWSLAEHCDWSDMLVEKSSSDLQNEKDYASIWFKKSWTPLCEKMNLDPRRKPDFFDSYKTMNFFSYLGEHGILGNEERIEEGYSAGKKVDQETLTIYYNKLIESPWKADDNPQAAKWLEEMKPLFDLYAKAVRMPTFVCYHQNSFRDQENSGLYMILLPDIQSQREFGGRLPSLRANFRIANGDIDGAIEDIETMLYNAKHLTGANAQCFVIVLVGNAIHQVAEKAILNLLKYGNPTEEQLARLDGIVRSFSDFIPIKDHPLWKIEKVFYYDLIDRLLNGLMNDDLDIIIENDAERDYLKNVSLLLKLPLDSNIVRQQCYYWLQKTDEYYQTPDPAKSKELKQLLDDNQKVLENYKMHYWHPSWLLINVRSKMIGDILGRIICQTSSAKQVQLETQSQNILTLTGIALDRYRLKNGHYPDSLDALVPEFLPTVPIDPWTQKTPLIYAKKFVKRAPEEEGEKLQTKDQVETTTELQTTQTSSESAQTETISDKIAIETVEQYKQYILYSVGQDLIDNKLEGQNLENENISLDINFKRFEK
ncbi:MAG: hypothetical protein Q4C95_09470 [Planctomycetia bacterium]|nr:hypothetical protein [Planctomycetia bacterium]